MSVRIDINSVFALVQLVLIYLWIGWSGIAAMLLGCLYTVFHFALKSKEGGS